MARTGTNSAASRPSLTRVRTICLGLPEAHEVEAWGDPTFRVRNKIFAAHKIGDGRESLWCKADQFERDALVEAQPNAFYIPPYVGPKGWIGIRLGAPNLDWKLVTDLIRQSFRLIAPKRLAASLGK